MLLEAWHSKESSEIIRAANCRTDFHVKGLVTPLFGWGSMATAEGASLAYLATRPAPAAADGGKRHEVGVIAHGPGAKVLARCVANQICTWDTGFRDRGVQFGLTDDPSSEPATGRFVLPRPGRTVTVTWQ